MAIFTWHNGNVPEGMKVTQVYGLVFTKDGRMLLKVEKVGDKIMYSLAGGKPGCEKTTLAKFLEEKFNFIHFSADYFMLSLFGEIKDRNEFKESLKKCKEVIFDLSKKLLDKDIDVVLDFGFWTKNERNSISKNLKDMILNSYI